MDPLITFAIPTYNFGAYIGETLQSIEDNTRSLTPDQFEVIVLDGGSRDQTDQVMRAMMEKYTNIRYTKNTHRGGIDKDLDTVAGMATGDFIWLFSADDLLVDGWDIHLMPLLGGNSDIVLVPAVLCDIRMKPLRPNPIFRDVALNEPIYFHLSENSNSRHEYLQRIATLEALFSFMSAIVIKRSLWHSVPTREDYFGSCWAHCAKLMPLLNRETSITYLNQYIIHKRSGNDSFMEKGFVNRIAIAVDGWGRIIEEFFNDEEQKGIVYDALRKDIQLLLFIYAKITARDRVEIDKLNSMLSILYGDGDFPIRTRTYLFLYRAMPTSRLLNGLIQPLLPFLIRIRHKIKALLA